MKAYHMKCQCQILRICRFELIGDDILLCTSLAHLLTVCYPG